MINVLDCFLRFEILNLNLVLSKISKSKKDLKTSFKLTFYCHRLHAEYFADCTLLFIVYSTRFLSLKKTLGWSPTICVALVLLYPYITPLHYCIIKLSCFFTLLFALCVEAQFRQFNFPREIHRPKVYHQKVHSKKVPVNNKKGKYLLGSVFCWIMSILF